MKAFAFYGRVSSEDAQDPSLSIPRQLAACKRAVTAHGGEIAGWYWDVESGRKALVDRGHGSVAWQQRVEVHREGGLPELLAGAFQGLFYAVIVESIDRLSRMTVDATLIERDLERRDIGLFAADEPMCRGATSILTRPVKQSVAEWYVRDLIERSRRGMEESVRQGWHTGGRPPYGYLLQEHPHPNPAKAREGRRKHRLILDPLRAPVVLSIFEDYCLRRLGLGELVDKLNSDPHRYQPPSASSPDTHGKRWSRSQVWAILHNPKYTGYNVWGRHDKRPGRPRIRPREQWVWSPAPTHPAIVSNELFEQVELRASTNASTGKEAPASYPTRRTRRAGRIYVLRGRVLCGLCGRRMEGTHQKGSNYYRCRVNATRGANAARGTGHPGALQIKEDTILEHIHAFMDRQIFGPDRFTHLREQLSSEKSRGDSQELEQPQGEPENLDEALYRQTLRLEEHDDPTHPVVARAKQRIIQLTLQRHKLQDAMLSLERERDATQQAEAIESMLAAIPDLRDTWSSPADAAFMETIEALDLTVTYDKPKHTLELAATLRPEPSTLLNGLRPPHGGRGKLGVAGAGFEPATFGL